MDQPVAPFGDLTLRQFTEILASSQPVPGGGSAAAVAGALAASLVEMVASLSLGRSRYEPYQSTLERCGRVGRRLGQEFLLLADRDAAAYGAYSAALRLPRETDSQTADRRRALAEAARVAAQVPFECVQACAELIGAVEAMAGRSNVNAASDLLVAALLTEAGARGAGENVRANLPAIGDDEDAGRLVAQLDEMLHEVSTFTLRAREEILAGRIREPEDE
jgi:formiminotetrahydrofolate cyclodeaminase